ncbi:septal ring lytic transglycosylase RlpA family protein [Arenimonas sp.]|uniref:septal ring lytic transglycosylase RlpA family protein n=1 Tax=Arenimonas sp. TaxID=1872635 RepID=UPI0035AF8468
MRLALACLVVLLAACAGKPTRPVVPATEPAGSPRSAAPSTPAAASAQALQAACVQVREHRDEDYTAGGLYAPGVSDSAPTDPLDISGLVEPVPGHEPLARYGNRSPYTVLGKSYRVLDRAEGYRERGIASWYGQKFHGRHTSSREIYDMCSFSAAHKTLPLPSFARVTRLDTGESVVVRVNDRGPFHEGRIIDLSYAAAVKLGLDRSGTARVEVEALVPAGDAPRLAASDASPRLPAMAPVPAAVAMPADDGRRRILQVGAYRDRDNARRIARQIEDAGIRGVDVVPVKVNGDKLWRVRIGPLAAGAANQALESLRALGLPSPRVFIE